MKKLESLNGELFRTLTDAEISMVAGAGSWTFGSTSSSTRSPTYSGGVEADSTSDSDPDAGGGWDF